MPQSAITPNTVERRKQRGVTLMEMAMCMMIMAVLSVGVSAVVRTGVETKLAQRNDINMQSIGMNFSEDLRTDIRTADSAILPAGGSNSMTLTTALGNVTYSLDTGTGQLTRTGPTGLKKIYNDPITYNNPKITISCQGVCFAPGTMNHDASPSTNEVSVAKVIIAQGTSQRTIIDNTWGTANFSLVAFSFNLTGATEFQ